MYSENNSIGDYGLVSLSYNWVATNRVMSFEKILLWTLKDTLMDSTIRLKPVDRKHKDSLVVVYKLSISFLLLVWLIHNYPYKK